jgi:hypothetical protein
MARVYGEGDLKCLEPSIICATTVSAAVPSPVHATVERAATVRADKSSSIHSTVERATTVATDVASSVHSAVECAYPSW